jgi:hypothetical protein
MPLNPRGIELFLHFDERALENSDGLADDGVSLDGLFELAMGFGQGLIVRGAWVALGWLGRGVLYGCGFGGFRGLFFFGTRGGGRGRLADRLAGRLSSWAGSGRAESRFERLEAFEDGGQRLEAVALCELDDGELEGDAAVRALLDLSECVPEDLAGVEE